jgi:ribokinase
MKIAVVGSIIVDLVARAPRPPERGETVTGESLSIVPGGKGANQALACARMGASAGLVGSVGQDGFAALALETLAQAGVDLSGVHRSVRSKTGVAFIVIGDRSDNTILVLRGANDDMPASHLEAMTGRIAGADALLVQLEIPLPLVEEAMGIARKAGVPVLLDPAPALAIPDSVISLADIVTPNEQETRTLTGIDPSSEAAALEAALALHRRGARRVVVKRGAGGCLASDGRAHRVVPGLPVDAVDTVGAGDCFAGALAVRWLECGDFFEACRFANAASALKVGRHGAQAGIPARAEVDAFLQSVGG